MTHWGHPLTYLEQARDLMSLSAEDLERDEAWVLLVEGAVAGFYRLSHQGDSAEIKEFHLEPRRIGHGLGRRMFEHAVARARQIGARWLTWTTDRNALGFYLRMGAKVTGTEPSSIADDEPLTCMRFDLSAS